ncbi:hypothetical protein L7F22_048067 [Adiantum nelumboides]|nr:hypothetical protein [Adiantum nelumboides]
MGSAGMGDLGQTANQHAPAQNGSQQAKQEQEEEEEEEKKEQRGETKKVKEEQQSVSLITISEDPPAISIIAFEEFQRVLASLCGAAAVTSQLRAHRDALVGKLDCLLETRKQSLHRIDELEVLKMRLRSKDLSLENAKVSLQEKSEDVAIAKDKLLPSARSLLAAGKSLAVAHDHLQVYRPIHAVAHKLHPLWRDEKQYENKELEQGIQEYFEHWAVGDVQVMRRLEDDLLLFHNKSLSFGRSTALLRDTLLQPVSWWEKYAKSAPTLDACKHLEGEGGQGRLLHLRSSLRARRRLMVSQIAALYPIVPAPSFVPIGKSPTPNAALSQQRHLANIIPQSSDSSNKDIKSVDKNDSLPMTIGGLHVVAPLNTRPGLYTEPSDHESSATALGYVAHSLALLAACLDVPLRYPIRLGASRSYIQDYAPIVESNEAATNGAGPSSGGLRRSLVEFPLFNEGQDSTRSAYAVFLLNKDLEQVLNYMGAESVGPRHTLPNLNKIIKLVCSGACTPA